MKKIVILLIILFPLFVQAYPQGDVNGNDKVDSADYILVRKHILKQSTLTGDRLKRADVNNDGKVSSLDFVAIRKTIINGGSATPTPSQNLTEADKICESVKNNTSIDYKSFDNLKKDNDDYYAIKAAHECANKYNKPVVVTNGVYNIYKKLNNGFIPVMTSTNLNGSTIYIHDEILTVNNQKKADYDGHIFRIIDKNGVCQSRSITKYNSYNKIIDLVNNELKYNYAYVQIVNKKGITNETKTNNVFRRFKSATSITEGNGKTDAFRIKNGKVIDDLFWDSSNYNESMIESVSVCEIPSTTLEFKNGIFKTIISTNSNLKEISGYVSRNIAVYRSNTVVNNIKHSYIENQNISDSSKETLAYKMNYRYTGFFRFDRAADLKFTNSVVYGLNGYDSDTGDSTYDMLIQNIVNMEINNVKMYNDDQLSQDLWGVTGTNHSKYITFDNCKLNRIDAHEAILHLTVKNTTLGKHGLSLTGAGSKNNNTLNIDNVKVIGSTHGELINLRHDYCSTWNGKITIKNTILKPMAGSDTAYLIYVTPPIIKSDNEPKQSLHNCGYDLWLPDVEIIDLQVVGSTINNFYVFNKSIIYLNSLPLIKQYPGDEKIKTHYDPIIKIGSITGTNKKMNVYEYPK